MPNHAVEGSAKTVRNLILLPALRWSAYAFGLPRIRRPSPLRWHIGSKMTPDDLITAATDFYLKSRDFNGYPAHHIHRVHEIEYGIMKDIFATLINDGRGTIIFGDIHPNPHIRAFQDEPSAAQLEKLEKLQIEHS